MEREEALRIAERMPVGTHKRVQCCASDNSRVIWRTSEGMYSKCFRCDVAFKASFTPTLAELQEQKKRFLEWNLKPISAPDDCSDDLPGHALAWLAVRSCTERMWKGWSGWSARLQRLCCSLFWDGELDAVLLKNTAEPRPKPKYTVRYRNGSFCTPVFLNGTMYTDRISALPECKRLVIVEDVLSAARVSDAGYLSMAIVGTHSDIHIIARVLAISTNEIVIWLDGDKGGQMGAKKLYRKLALAGAQVHVLKTQKDPKYYTNHAIQEFITSVT